MNYLAHLYLSGHDEALRFGNFIADGIRANQYKHYPERIQEGIILHRKIDAFTDSHPIFRKHCKLLFPDHGHYARVILDVIYDHFLALSWDNYHPEPLEEYAANFYRSAKEKKEYLPLKMQRLFRLMREQNWLVEYHSLQGLERILFHMSKRTAFPSNFPKAIKIIEAEKEQLILEFHTFFLELENYSNNQL